MSGAGEATVTVGATLNELNVGDRVAIGPAVVTWYQGLGSVPTLGLREYNANCRVSETMPWHDALPAVARFLVDHSDFRSMLARRHALANNPYVYDGQPEGQYRADCDAISALISALGGFDG